MRVRIRTNRNYDPQNPPDQHSISHKASRGPPRNCALFLKAEVRVSPAVEWVSEGVERCEVLSIVYLQGSFVSQRNRDFGRKGPGGIPQCIVQFPLARMVRPAAALRSARCGFVALPPLRALFPPLDVSGDRGRRLDGLRYPLFPILHCLSSTGKK